jgi:hypothetical protein
VVVAANHVSKGSIERVTCKPPDKRDYCNLLILPSRLQEPPVRWLAELFDPGFRHPFVTQQAPRKLLVARWNNRHPEQLTAALPCTLRPRLAPATKVRRNIEGVEVVIWGDGGRTHLEAPLTKFAGHHKHSTKDNKLDTLCLFSGPGAGQVTVHLEFVRFNLGSMQMAKAAKDKAGKKYAQLVNTNEGHSLKVTNLLKPEFVTVEQVFDHNAKALAYARCLDKFLTNLHAFYVLADANIEQV